MLGAEPNSARRLRGGRWGTAAVGLATLAAGAVAVFVSNNEAGAAALVAAGTVLTGLVVLGDRLESLEYGGMKLQLLAADKFKAAEAAELKGDPVLAETLREEAQALIDQARPFAKSYGLLRASLGRSPERSRAMEQLMHEVRRTALDNDLGMDNELASQTVLKMLIDGDEGERAFALALMEGDPGLAQVEPIAAAIRNPKSRFEQYHSLLVAKSLLDDGLDESGRKLLKDAADTALADSAYMDSPSRAALALSIRDGA